MLLFQLITLGLMCYVYSVLGMRLPYNDANAIEPSIANLTGDPNKDMYVIHATVYQVGIITNKTDDDASYNSSMGNQEAITFYHTNGSDINLGNIPEPLLTNVTAQRVVGVAPVQDSTGNQPSNLPPWGHLDLSSGHQLASDSVKELRQARHVDNDENKKAIGKTLTMHSSDNKTPVKIVSGVAEIPQVVGMQSIAIPPLLSFNNNFSEVPVPIPNTSVIHYAKVNTLVRTP